MLIQIALGLIYLFEKWPVTLIVLASVLPYARCLVCSEWYIDELFAIVRNEDAKNESSWLGVFSHDFWGNPLWVAGHWTHKSYRPLTVLTYCLEFFIAGQIKPQPLRAFSMLVHTFNSVMLYAVVWKFLYVTHRTSEKTLSRIGGKSKADSKAAKSIANGNESDENPARRSSRTHLFEPEVVKSTDFLLRDTVLIAKLLVPNAWAITLACCLFAAHPVHVENVVYLVGRADMLSTSIWCLVFYIYLDSNQLALFPLHALLCITAGLCKESGFMVIPFLTTVEVTRRQKNIPIGMLFLMMFLCIFGLRSYITGGTTAGFSFVDTPVQYSGSLMTRTLTYLFQHAYYAKLIIMPWYLAWDYSYNAIPLLKAHLEDCRTLLIAATYLGLVSMVSYFSNKYRSHLGLVGVFWLLVPFLPACNLFFIVGVTVGERLVYTSTCGMAFVVPALICGFLSTDNKNDSTGKLESREDVMSSEELAQSLAYAPESSGTESDEGVTAGVFNAPSKDDVEPERGSSKTRSRSRTPVRKRKPQTPSNKNVSNSDADSSLTQFRQHHCMQSSLDVGCCLKAMAEDKHGAFFTVGRRLMILALFFSMISWLTIFCYNCAVRVTHWDSRVLLFAEDTKNWPKGLKGHHQIGTVYHRMNRWEDALYHYNSSLAIHDDNALTDYCIAQLYIETSRFDEALPIFEKIFAGHGIGFAGYNTFALYIDYGFVLQIKGRYEEAINALEHGLKINADMPHGWNALGMSFYGLGMLQEAQDKLAEGLKWEEDHPFLWNNLACVWMLAEAYEQAQMALIKAIDKEADNPIFHYNIQILNFLLEGKKDILDTHKPRMEMFYNRMN